MHAIISFIKQVIKEKTWGEFHPNFFLSTLIIMLIVWFVNAVEKRVSYVNSPDWMHDI